MKNEDRLALAGDQMFQRSLMKRVAKDRELIVTTSSGVDFKGFVSGLDEEWIQLTLTVDGHMCVWLNTMLIESIRETGKTLETVNFSSSQQRAVRDYTRVLRNKATSLLGGSNDVR